MVVAVITGAKEEVTWCSIASNQVLRRRRSGVSARTPHLTEALQIALDDSLKPLTSPVNLVKKTFSQNSVGSNFFICLTVISKTRKKSTSPERKAGRTNKRNGGITRWTWLEFDTQEIVQEGILMMYECYLQTGRFFSAGIHPHQHTHKHTLYPRVSVHSLRWVASLSSYL